MDESQILAILEDFGLTEKEVKVYLSNLKIGSSRVNEIAKQAGILRETTYFVLKSLIDKGLVNYVIKSGVKYFEAASPNKLLTILKEKEEKINSVLPQLLIMERSITEKPKVELYEGREGLKTVIDDLIKTGDEILTFSSTKSLIQKLRFYFPNYIRRHVKENIPIKVLTERSPETEELRKSGKKELRELRFISKKYEFPNAIYIYGNKIAILDLEKNLIGIIIESSALNKTFRTIFNIAWDSAE